MMLSKEYEQIGALCAATPTLTVLDARGLTVRQVAYHCTPKAPTLRTERVTQHRYDAAGRLISSIDPKLAASNAGSNLVTSYSLSGRVLRTDSVDAGWRACWYGAAGQVLQTTDARGTCTRTEYDSLLRPLAIHEKMQDDKEQCVERFTYGTHGDTANNRQGRLIRHDDPAGTREIKSYSLTGAVQHEVRSLLPAMLLPDWPKDEEERDNRLERQYKGEKAQYYETHWTYNALGELLSQKDAQNNEQYFKYNIAGQLQAASVKLCGSETKQPVVKEVIYNASGQALQEENGNRVVTKYTYEPETQRLSSLCTSRLIPSGRLQELQTLQYYYDPVGNILRINDRIPCTKFFANKIVRATSTYRYDALYQLVQATGREHARAQRGRKPSSSIAPILPSTYVNYVRTYEYDAGGNLTTIQGGTGASRFKMAQGSNRLAQVVSNLQAKKSLSKLDYDAHGNPTTLSSGQTLTWDARNQLCRVTPVSRLDAPDDEESYQYESSGQRIRKTTHTLVDRETHAMRCAEVIYLPGLEIRRRYSSSGTLSEELHVICAGTAGRAQVRIQHWAQPKRQIEDAPPQDQFRYSLSNHLGSSVLELNQAAEILSYEEYYPFGGTAIWSTKSEVEADYKVMRYSGKERDATGLYYYGFRYYAPWLGRWLNPDPAGTVDGLNLFGMVKNNPIMLEDPDGLAAVAHRRVASKRSHKSSLRRGRISRTAQAFSDGPSQRTRSRVHRTHAIQHIDETINQRHEMIGEKFLRRRTKAGLDQAQSRRIKRLLRGHRPDPKTYLRADFIDGHLSNFYRGASYLVQKKMLDDYGRNPVGRPDGQFVMSRGEMNQMLGHAKGDIAAVETKLGIPAGAWQGQELVRIDINVRGLQLRIPSGNEMGANDLWIPGGELPTGQREAVINSIPKGRYREGPLWYQGNCAMPAA